mgnify:FL=1
MADIIYYIVPDNHIHISEAERNLLGVGDETWTEVVITDSRDIYNGKSVFQKLMIEFFSDNIEKLVLLLWALKDKEETLFVEAGLDDEYEPVEVCDIEELSEAVCKVYEKSKGYSVIYKDASAMKKRIINDRNEIFYLYVKNDEIEIIEEVLNKWAKKENFVKYELGE